MRAKNKPMLGCALVAAIPLMFTTACSAGGANEGASGHIVVALSAPRDGITTERCALITATRNAAGGPSMSWAVSVTPDSEPETVLPAPAGRLTVEGTLFDGAPASESECTGEATYRGSTSVFLRPSGEAAAHIVLRALPGALTVSVEYDDLGEPAVDECPAGESWLDEFEGPALDPAWSVFEYTDARHNGQTSPANHIELVDGALRYTLDPMTAHPYGIDYMPWYDGAYYWYDPGLELSRPVTGTHWTLDVAVDWHVPSSVNSAGFAVQVVVDDPDALGVGCAFERYSNDDSGGSYPDANLFTASCFSEQSMTRRAPYDPSIVRTVRFERDGDQIAVSLSSDGTTFEELLRSDDLPEELHCASQRVLISGQGWFSPSGAYADYASVQVMQGAAE